MVDKNEELKKSKLMAMFLEMFLGHIDIVLDEFDFEHADKFINDYRKRISLNESAGFAFDPHWQEKGERAKSELRTFEAIVNVLKARAEQRGVAIETFRKTEAKKKLPKFL